MFKWGQAGLSRMESRKCCRRWMEGNDRQCSVKTESHNDQDRQYARAQVVVSIHGAPEMTVVAPAPHRRADVQMAPTAGHQKYQLNYMGIPPIWEGGVLESSKNPRM